LLPDLKADHLAVNSLMPEAEPVAEAAKPVAEEPPVLVEAPPILEGPERRTVVERRVLAEARAHERRAFGRRSTDYPFWGVK
jgi:hypothetical protein